VSAALINPRVSEALPDQVQLVFGGQEKPLFGVLHPCDASSRSNLGVVLCNPLGYEAMCVHRAYRHLAERLASRGIASLRFDYHGTGDSSGEAHDPCRLKDWLSSIRAAMDALRARTGVCEVGLFGVRFGATLAMQAASERSDAVALALWAPSPSGSAYVRELRAFRLIKERSPGPTDSSSGAGTEGVAGYPFDEETVRELSAVDMHAATVRPAPRVLILPRDDLPGAEERLARGLERLGATVSRSAAKGYALMMRDPEQAVVPFEAIDEVTDWFGGQRSNSRSTSAAREPARSVMISSVSGKGAREELMRFGDGRRLFGILSEPLLESRGSHPKSALLCLNVGANHHVGPNRMYVTLARRLAMLGQSSFRFDIGGLGDSAVAPGQRETRLYSKDSVEDVRQAMSFLATTRDVKHFVLMGLCSGAYLAFHTAVEDPRVTGQVLLNPQTFEWEDGDTLELSTRRGFQGTRYYARSLLQWDVWARTLRGEVDVRGIVGALRSRVRSRASTGLNSLAAGLQGRARVQSDVERAFVSLSDRGVKTLLVFGANDGGLDMIEKHLGRHARKMRARKNFELEVVDGADHTFTPLESQAKLEHLVTEFMRRATAAVPS
jgi:pimeloyl-ACP methyl ester carboxylesterase